MKKVFFLATLYFLFSLTRIYAQPFVASSLDQGLFLPSLTDTVPGGGVSNPVTWPLNYNYSLTNFNYTRTWLPSIPITDPSVLTPTCLPSQVNSKMTTVYTNGFGSPLESISRFTNTYKDLVTFYDNRSQINKFSYLSYPVTQNSSFVYSPYTDQKNYYHIYYPYEDYTSFGESLVAQDHSIYNYAPGKTTVGQFRGTQTITDINSENEVVKWDIEPVNYVPISLGYYDAGDLAKQTTQSFDGGHVDVFVDKEGKKICEKVYTYGDCGTSACATYLTTYYIYDPMGRLLMTIPPKAMDYVFAGTFTTQQIVKDLCSYVVYDNLGRAIRKHTPGQEGEEYLIYNSQDRLILSTTPLLMQENKWNFYLYDNTGRPTTVGIYETTQSYQDLLDIVNNTSNYYYYYDPLNFFYYLFFNQQYTSGIPIANCEVLVENYYDNYNWTPAFIPNIAFDFNQYNGYFIAGGNAMIPESTYNAFGKATGSRVRILTNANNTPTNSPLSDWITTVNFYDEHGNIIQTYATNAQGGTDISSAQYDWANKPLLKILNHTNPLCSSKPATITAKYYNYSTQTSSLLEVRQKIDNGDWMQLATYTHDDFGRVAQKNIGGVETQQYRYNLRGQMIGINPQYAEQGITNGPMTFGESIRFDLGTTDPLYNGNISSIIWRGSSAQGRSSSYGYKYDPSGRLRFANYTEMQPGCSGASSCWVQTYADFSVPNISYDDGGNITKMQQMGWGIVNSGGTTSMQQTMIDNLTYNYSDNQLSNKLQSVSDAATYNGVNDFVDNNTGEQDYDYDYEGNMKQDLNKGISNIVYNFMGKPEKITFNSGQTITYIYDALKNKVHEETNDGSTITVYDYDGTIQYKNSQMYLMYHDEGRVRYHPDQQGNMFWDYDYFVKDHLGNIRTVLNAQPESALDYFASHELSSAHLENLSFSNIDNVRNTKPGACDIGDQEAADLIGTDPSRTIGTSIMLQVMAGDRFELSADNFYDTPESYSWQSDNVVSPNSLMNNLISTLVSGPGAFNQGEGAANQSIIQNLISPTNFLNTFEGIKAGETDPTRPQAFLNYLVFDNKMNLVPEQSGVLQVNGAQQWTTQSIGSQINIANNGFLLVYISNESSRDVYFDNINLRYYRGQLIEENHYYPYGLAINDATIPPLVDKQCLYQGNECNTSFGLNLDDFQARNYDPQIGRFVSMDPIGAEPGGYMGMANNPVSQVDPNGQNPFVIGAVIGAGTGLIEGLIKHDKGNTLVDDVLEGAAIGAITGGLGDFIGPVVDEALPVSGFFGGAVSGVASGAVSGFIGGVANAEFSGNGNALQAGLSGALFGGITGGLADGIATGIGAASSKGNFWDGTLYGDDMPVEGSQPLSPDELKDAKTRLANYRAGKTEDGFSMATDMDNATKGVNEFFKDVHDHLPTWQYNTNGAFAGDEDDLGQVVGLSKTGYLVNANGGEVEARTWGVYQKNVYTAISPSTTEFVGTPQSYNFQAAVGHELIHAFHYYTIQGHWRPFSEDAAYWYSGNIYYQHTEDAHLLYENLIHIDFLDRLDSRSAPYIIPSWLKF